VALVSSTKAFHRTHRGLVAKDLALGQRDRAARLVVVLALVHLLAVAAAAGHLLAVAVAGVLALVWVAAEMTAVAIIPGQIVVALKHAPDQRRQRAKRTQPKSS